MRLNAMLMTDGYHTTCAENVSDDLLWSERRKIHAKSAFHLLYQAWRVPTTAQATGVPVRGFRWQDKRDPAGSYLRWSEVCGFRDRKSLCRQGHFHGKAPVLCCAELLSSQASHAVPRRQQHSQHSTSRLHRTEPEPMSGYGGRDHWRTYRCGLPAHGVHLLKTGHPVRFSGCRSWRPVPAHVV